MRMAFPVDDTIARVMRKLNTKQFANCFTSWIRAVTKATDGDVIAIDGKTLRRSFNTQVTRSQRFIWSVLGVPLMALY